MSVTVMHHYVPDRFDPLICERCGEPYAESTRSADHIPCAKCAAEVAAYRVATNTPVPKHWLTK